MSNGLSYTEIGYKVVSSNDGYIHLYDKTQKNNFQGNGIAVLQPTECKLDTSKWEWTMTLPKDKWNKWKLVEPFSIIKAPCYTEDCQLWRVKTIAQGDGEIYLTGTPIFFDINWISPFPFYYHGTGSVVLEKYQNKLRSDLGDVPYMLRSDSPLTTIGVWTNKTDNDWLGENFLTSLNSNGNKSFTWIFGGLVQYDNYYVRVLRTPTDKGLTYRLGVNLPSGAVEEDIDVSNLTTRIIAGGKSATSDRWYYVTTTTGSTESIKFITSSKAGNYPADIQPVKVFKYEDIKFKEYDDGTTPTEQDGDVYTNWNEFLAALESRARLEFTDNHIDEPRINIKIDLTDIGHIVPPALMDPAQKAVYQELQSATLGEKVRVIHEEMGLEITGRITDLVYNALTKCCEKITIGNERIKYNNESLYTLLGGD